MAIGSSLDITLPTQGANTGTWGTDLNTELQKIIDAVEAQVPISAVNFNATIDVENQGMEDIDYLEFSAGGGTGDGARSLYMDTSGELVFIDANGNSVQITSSGTLNSAALAGITGSGYGSGGIEINWNGTQYDFFDGASDYAPIRVNDVRLANSGFFVTIDAPALSASYSFTVPSAAPGSAAFLQMDTSGNVTASNTMAQAVTFSSTASVGSTLTVSGDCNVTGDVTHGNRVLPVSAVSTYPIDSGGGPSINAAGYWNAGGVSEICWLPIPLKVGDRIRSMVVTVYGGDTSTKTLALRTQDLTDGTTNQEASTTTAQGASVAQVTISSIDYTIEANHAPYFSMTSLHANDRIYGVVVTYDRP